MFGHHEYMHVVRFRTTCRQREGGGRGGGGGESISINNLIKLCNNLIQAFE